MNHGGMDHGGMQPKCSMHMLWNTAIIDTCVVFKQWHISGPISFLLTWVAIVLLAVGYEWLRYVQTRLDVQLAAELIQARNSGNSLETPEQTPLLIGGLRGPWLARVPPVARFLRSAMYGVTVAISFFLMLIFMTYNAYLIAAVVIGATVGHFIFSGLVDPDAMIHESGTPGKGAACH